MGLGLGPGLGLNAVYRVSMFETLLLALSTITEQEKTFHTAGGVISLCVFYTSANNVSPFLQYTLWSLTIP